MSGLCSVLDSLRQSLESESESENDDLDPDGNFSNNSHAHSWQGSLQQLPTTPSTSESEAGNMSSESHLCRQCGRARRRERARASGCSSLPPGKRLRPRIKKRAHFATDTDNSSDPERLSDSHESSLLFKPIAPSPNFMSTPLVSLSPREIKSVTFTSDTRPASVSAIPIGQVKVARPDTSITSASPPYGPASRGPPPSLDIARGRKPFKADHELFKRPPSGLPCGVASLIQQQRPHGRPSSSSTASPTSPSPPPSAAAACGSPALPPRHPIKSNHSGHGKHHHHQHQSPSSTHPHSQLHNHSHSHSQQQHHQRRRNSVSSGDLSDPTRDSGYSSSIATSEITRKHCDGGSGGGCSSDNDVERRGRQFPKRGPPVAPRSASASRIGSRQNSNNTCHQPTPPSSLSLSSYPASLSSIQPPSPAPVFPPSTSLLPPPPPALLVTPPDSPSSELPPPPPLPPPPEVPLSELTSSKPLPPPPPPPPPQSSLLPSSQVSSLKEISSQSPSIPSPPPESISGTPPLHPSARKTNTNFIERTSNQDISNHNFQARMPSRLDVIWNIARSSSVIHPNREFGGNSNKEKDVCSQKNLKNDTRTSRFKFSEEDHVSSPPTYEDAIKRVSIFRTVVNGSLPEQNPGILVDNRSADSGKDSSNEGDADIHTGNYNGARGEAHYDGSKSSTNCPHQSLSAIKGGDQTPSPVQNGFVGRSIRLLESRSLSATDSNDLKVNNAGITNSNNHKTETKQDIPKTWSKPPMRPASSTKTKNGLACHSAVKQGGSDVTPPMHSLSNGHQFVPGFSREDSHISDDVFLADDDSRDRDEFADESSGSFDNGEDLKGKMPGCRKSTPPAVPARSRSSGSSRKDSGTIKLKEQDTNSKNIILEVLV